MILNIQADLDGTGETKAETMGGLKRLLDF